MVRPWQLYISRINSGLVVLLAFFLPISTTAVTITSFLLIAGWLAEGEFRERLREIVTNPVCLAVLVYLGVMVIGLCWSRKLSTGLAAIGEQIKILMLPVFLTSIRHEHRWRYLGAFIAGVTVIMLSTYLAWFGLLQYADVTSEHLTRKTTHVFYNPMLAFSIYLLLHKFCWAEPRGWRRGLLLALVGIMTINMFITEGRTGQFVFLILMCLFLVQYLRKNIIKALSIMIIVLPLLILISYSCSTVFRGRVDQARYEISEFKTNPMTSIGLRLHYWRTSWWIIQRHPWFGVGTGDFHANYAQMNRFVSPMMPYTVNPHNQYLLTGVQLGLVGVVNLLALFFVHLYLAWRLKDGWGRIRVAFPLFFLVIMITESYLVIAETGFLYTLISAVLAKHGENWQTRTGRSGPGQSAVRSVQLERA